jgi:hypothetical protein
MYLWMALRGEIPAPAVITLPDECATHPHRTGRVPHPPEDAIPDIRTPIPIPIPPLTLAEQLPKEGHFFRRRPGGSASVPGLWQVNRPLGRLFAGELEGSLRGCAQIVAHEYADLRVLTLDAAVSH